jgi:hypothetical protein
MEKTMEEVEIEISEFVNRVITDQQGTRLYIDRDLLDDVIAEFEKLKEGGCG